jgi:hypothetical protein
MSMPPPLPVQPKPGVSTAKVLLIIFGSVAAVVVLALAGLFVLGRAVTDTSVTVRGESYSGGRPASVSFTPGAIEARCRASGLDYHALARDSRLEGRATEAQREQLEAKGIKIYRAKIRKKSDVVYIISIIESPRDFTSSQAKEILEILEPATPVAVHGKFIYCNAGRPDPKGRGDEIIWMTPQALFEAL